jgi:single-strand DNA-binding protein
MSFCKLMFIGNLGRDPEMRYTPSGRPVTQFTVAVNQSTKNQQTGEWTEETDWFRVSIWGDRAERAAEQLRKGNRVFVEGRFKSREYTGSDGTTRTSLDVTADNVISLERRERTEDEAGGFSAAPPRPAARPAEADAGDLDDLPF